MEVVKNKVATVCVQSGLEKTLDYLIPNEIASLIKVGSLVHIPIRDRQEVGVVVALSEDTNSSFKLKAILHLLPDEISISPELVDLAKWISSYYICSLQRVLSVMIPKSLREKSTSEKAPLFVLKKVSLKKLAEYAANVRAQYPSQALVLDIMLKAKKGILLTQLLELASVSRSPVDTLVKKGLLTLMPQMCEEFTNHKYFPTLPKKLNTEQSLALEAICKSLDEQDSRVHLLLGVTGSGKTEIYLQAIDHMLKSGGSCLLMVPEISLTPQTIERIHCRFGDITAILHYKLSNSERHEQWKAIASGKARIIVGARSSVFCPAPNLKLIIVDEEHEGSYKSEESPHYNSRDVALERAKRAKATVILGSATPSLESYKNAITGKYNLLSLNSRASATLLADVQMVDMLEEREKNGFRLFSTTLIEELKKTLERCEQVMLFLNRRGYFTSVQCSCCGSSLKCPHCDVYLTFHRSRESLVCHLCHYTTNAPTCCPHCKAPGTLKYRGWGTEHVEACVKRLFPLAKTIRIDADTTRHKGAMEGLLREFRTHKADILIGTQMIAKGHHFPGLTLVGVLNPDAQLLLADFRASEHLFQLLVQVFGRSGRSHLKGKVILQSAQLQTPIYRLAANQEYIAFAESELKVRELFAYPPFIHMIKVTLQAEDESKVLQRANEFYEELIKNLPKSCAIAPPGEGAWRKLQDQWRQVILIKCPNPLRLSEFLLKIRMKYQTQGLYISYDVDCQNIG